MIKKKRTELSDKNDVSVDDVHRLLIKKAFGYTVQEEVEEYSSDGEDRLKLIKRKVTTKHIPPDLASARAVLEYLSADIDYTKMTDKELCDERDRLIRLLNNEEVNDGTDQDGCGDEM